MRHAFFAVVVMLAIFASADVLAQVGPPVENPDPGDGGSGGVVGCYTCDHDPLTNTASCTFEATGGHWADCVGGQMCYRFADGSEDCHPFCGYQRCYLA